MTDISALGIGLRAAQILGIASTAFVSGKTFSASFNTIPALLLAPAPLLSKQWKQMFHSDRSLAPAVVLFSGGVFGYLAYIAPPSASRTLYTASTTLLALAIPYSYFALEPVNRKLEVISSPGTVDARAEHGPRKDETAHYLVDRWGTINLGRTVLTGLAGILAAWAVLEERIGR